MGSDSERIYEMRFRHRAHCRENEMTFLCFLGIRRCVTMSGNGFCRGRFSACSRGKTRFARRCCERLASCEPREILKDVIRAGSRIGQDVTSQALPEGSISCLLPSGVIDAKRDYRSLLFSLTLLFSHFICIKEAHFKSSIAPPLHIFVRN